MAKEELLSFEGTVVELGIFATRVRTGLGDEVTLPNNLALANVSVDGPARRCRPRASMVAI